MRVYWSNVIVAFFLNLVMFALFYLMSENYDNGFLYVFLVVVTITGIFGSTVAMTFKDHKNELMKKDATRSTKPEGEDTT